MFFLDFLHIILKKVFPCSYALIFLGPNIMKYPICISYYLGVILLSVQWIQLGSWIKDCIDNNNERCHK